MNHDLYCLMKLTQSRNLNSSAPSIKTPFALNIGVPDTPLTIVEYLQWSLNYFQLSEPIVNYFASSIGSIFYIN
jgi:hypothetical protein